MNLAPRIEGLTRLHGSNVRVSEDTRSRVGNLVEFVELPIAAVKGTLHPVRTFVPSVLHEVAA